MHERFIEWLDNEIDDLQHSPDSPFVSGKLSEAIRIRAKAGEMDAKEYPPDLEEVAGKICDKYCRFPEAYDDTDRMFAEKCEGCPLNELMKGAKV